MLSFSDLPRESAPGVRFKYSDIETQILGLVLRAAVGTSIAQYMREKIWQPMGAEADACWLVDNVGQEAAYCCFNATLRDYGRFGILLSNDGTLGEKKIVPNSFVIDATSHQAHPAYMHPGNATPSLGYGYQTWIFPGNERSFALIGTRGQSIFVHQGLKLIMVQTAVWQKYLDQELGRERNAFWLSLVTNFR
jgi:CubicO group peptidase (beta-lactamase class C family)